MPRQSRLNYLGTPPAGDATLTVADVLRRDGTDWGVKRHQSGFVFEPGTGYVAFDGDVALPDGKVLRMVPESYHNVRQDEMRSLGHVKSRYTELQNLQQFGLLDGIEGLRVQDSGSFKGGSKVYLRAQIGGEQSVVPGDDMALHLYFRTSHDGSTPLQVFLMVRRLICENALNNMLKSGEAEYVRIPHTISAESKFGLLQDVVRGASVNFQGFMHIAQRMANRQLKEADWQAFLNKVAPLPQSRKDDPEADVLWRRAQEKREGIQSRWFSPDYASCIGSLWGALNAVTGYYDHDAEVPGSKKLSPEAEAHKRLELAAFDGRWATAKTAAYREAVGILSS